MERKQNRLRALLLKLVMPVIALAALLFFISAIDSLDSGRETEELRQLEDALRKSCVACYAAEGVYPPDVAYLEEHYGIQLDHKRYTVHYDIFAENLMPDITVMENKI